jgi:nicotinic acid mononucleotide adenylyltransferase
MSINYNNDNTIIFTLARMNPPTPGHLYLIQTLIYQAISKNIDKVYVILSKTNDNNQNPITCQEKINVLGEPDDTTKTMINTLKHKLENETVDTILKSKIANIKVITICVPDQKGATPFTPLIPIVGSLPEANLILIIGDDRKNMLDSITDFFFKWDNVHSIAGIILPRQEMSEYKEKSKIPEELDKLNISDVPINAMSATVVRNIVMNHRRDKFTELYSPYLDKDKIPGLYEDILQGVESLPQNTKPEEREKPLKYIYPMIKGVSEFTIKAPRKTTEKTTEKPPRKSTRKGGKKMKRKDRKTKRKSSKKQLKRSKLII